MLTEEKWLVVLYGEEYEAEKQLADAWSDYREVVNLAEAADVPITVYDGCNHSLETDNTADNLVRLQDIMRITAAFLNAD